tara:strand:+ start:1058 stop:1237 length:180 start_codon:yes stop_codon:yes gene_type:complete
MIQDPIDEQVDRAAQAVQKFADRQKEIAQKRDDALNTIVKDAELKKAAEIKDDLLNNQS